MDNSKEEASPQDSFIIHMMNNPNEKAFLLNEYKLIQAKQSKFSANARKGISFIVERGLELGLIEATPKEESI